MYPPPGPEDSHLVRVQPAGNVNSCSLTACHHEQPEDHEARSRRPDADWSGEQRREARAMAAGRHVHRGRPRRVRPLRSRLDSRRDPLLSSVWPWDTNNLRGWRGGVRVGWGFVGEATPSMRARSVQSAFCIGNHYYWLSRLTLRYSVCFPIGFG